MFIDNFTVIIFHIVNQENVFLTHILQKALWKFQNKFYLYQIFFNQNGSRTTRTI
jgi:hypothetical protein